MSLSSCVLTPEQRASFEEQGYLLASGLIPAEVVAAARARLEALMAERPGASFFGTDAANDCYTERLCAAAAELGGGADARPYFPVRSALAIPTYPGGEAWSWPPPHIDHALPQDGHRVFPRPYRLASLLYLSDVAPRAGGTVVWPGSHRAIERLAKSDPERFALMSDLNHSLTAAGLADPVEMTPKAGDILFYHYLLAHSGSRNTTDRPRIALNHKW